MKKKETAEDTYDFGEIKEHLKTIDSTKEKIVYLIERKTEYEQDSLKGWELDNPTFGEKCNLEISKIQELAKLENEVKPQIVEIGKHKDLTIDRVIFLFNRLIPDFADYDATKKAKFINFLTGFDYETVRQRFSSIYRKDSEKPQAFKKDMEVICKYLEELGLNEIVSEIKNDLDFN